MQKVRGLYDTQQNFGFYFGLKGAVHGKSDKPRGTVNYHVNLTRGNHHIFGVRLTVGKGCGINNGRHAYSYHGHSESALAQLLSRIAYTRAGRYARVGQLNCFAESFD